MINHVLLVLTFGLVIIWPMKVLKQNNTLEKFVTNAETHLEPREISTMELFGLTISPKSTIIDFQLDSKYASVIGEDIWK